MTSRSALIVGVLVLASLLRGFALAENATNQVSIADLQKRLAVVRDDVEQLLNTQADIYDQLDRVEAELELSSRLLRELRAQSRSLAGEIQATKDTIEALRQQSSIGNVTIASHLRAFYKRPLESSPFVPFASTDGARLDDRDYLFLRLISSDRQRLMNISSDLVSSEQLLANLNSRQQSLANVTSAKQTEEVRAKEAVTQRDRLLAQVKGQQRQKIRELEEIDKSSQTLGDIFEEIETKSRQTVEAVWQRERDFALRLKGRLFWPVRGTAVTSFGMHSEGDKHLLSKSNGLDIATSAGGKVIAAATGEVLYIGWARGLERFVVVAHGGSIYSLYGNLDQIFVSEGDQVIRGEQFATVTGSRLHFEVRDGKTAVDPAAWLRP